MFNRVGEILRDVWRWFFPPAIELFPLAGVDLLPLDIPPVPADTYQRLFTAGSSALPGRSPVAVLNHSMIVCSLTQEEKERAAQLRVNEGLVSRILGATPLRDNDALHPLITRESTGSGVFYAHNHAAPVGTTFPTQATMDSSPAPIRTMFP
jgi:hypothetical protein